jgi:drug/metabolite transporter (DMT)-like permease
MWGFVLWHQFPTMATWAGAGLTLLSGLYTLYQDQKESSPKAAASTEIAINPNDYEHADI